MIVVIICSVIALLFTYLETKGRFPNGMKWGFIIITVLGAIHYNYGSDYMAYLSLYNDITNTPFRWDNIVDNQYGYEPGWVLLNYLFSRLGGFFMMVAVLNIIQNAIYYFFIRDNVEKKSWTIAAMIYLMSSSLYILNFSMMRQGLAISLFVLAWPFIKKKRILLSLLIIGIASTIHYSAQVLFPFVLLPFLPLNKKVVATIYVGLIIALYVGSEFTSKIFGVITSIEELESTHSLDYYQANDSSAITYRAGFVINLIPFVISIWGLFAKDKMINDEKKMLIMFSLVSFIVAPFAQILQLLGRFGMYFSAYSVAAIPFVYSLLPNKKSYQLFMGIYVLMLIYSYYLFFNSELWMKSYSTFHTIFEVL